MVATLTVHIPRLNWLGIRERVHDQRKQCPKEEYNVCEKTDWTEPEGAVRYIVATADKKAQNRDGVAEIQKDDTCRYHPGFC